jgi:hypothetical protein
MPRLLADSRTVVIPSLDGQVYRWDLRPRTWLTVACRIAGRDLTHAEWRAAFGNREFRNTCPQPN